MMQATNSPDVYTDFSSLTALRKDARKDPQATLRKVAHQFESLYIKMMLKSMRQASLGDPIFDSDNSKLYRDMFDNQLAMDMSDHGGIGLADMLVRQLQRYVPGDHHQGDTHMPVRALRSPVAPVHAEALPARFTSQSQFIEKIWPLAEQAAKELNVPPQAVMAQAALESGWGQHVNQNAQGVSSHNLFNIKADASWKGPKVVVDTLEFEHGVAKRQKAAFRAYASYADCFRDYVDFLKSNPRYRTALTESDSAEAFAHNLHQAGYATDPAYASKLIDIMQRDVKGSPQSEFLASS
ncbi:MAG: flagellar assembly peptidoglycan hydrolase FlgJ [Gammaproteobacteria bacterium]|nr:flagellar assembly peptidoglycan hydrolase FlgJ [Gammaproteobacteria bacterium]